MPIVVRLVCTRRPPPPLGPAGGTQARQLQAQSGAAPRSTERGGRGTERGAAPRHRAAARHIALLAAENIGEKAGARRHRVFPESYRHYTDSVSFIICVPVSPLLQKPPPPCFGKRIFSFTRSKCARTGCAELAHLEHRNSSLRPKKFGNYP